MLDAAPHLVMRAKPAPGLRIEPLVIGQPAGAVADLLPRLFNLCRVAQGGAARAALGLPPMAGWQDALRQEIIRDHVAKMCLKWPAMLSLPPVALPRGWQTDAAELGRAVFGEPGRMPTSPATFADFLQSTVGCAPPLRAIQGRFPAHSACRNHLGTASPETMFNACAMENSASARHRDHPVMAGVEAEYGRGPLWSALGVAYDLSALLEGELPTANLQPGCATIPAARGLYGVRARVENGIVTQFARITPTDHLLAPGGALEQSLASLPDPRDRAAASMLLSILDPCYPVEVEPTVLREVGNA